MSPPPRAGLARIAALAALIGGPPAAAHAQAPTGAARAFAGFDLPDDWESRFWDDPGVKALLALEPKALAELVPKQAGLRFCRCPACDSDEADDTLTWSGEKPEVVTCKRCGASLPDEKFPAKVPPAPGQPPGIPEEAIEVLPRVQHKYPYHLVEPLKQRHPDERLYLAAKRDYEAKEALSKLALYAAVRHRDRPGADGPDLARLSAVLVLQFARVYPAYATHYDQPGQPKIFQQADLKPPYRHGYRTAKWDWAGCLDVPMNLLIAYALLRDSSAIDEAGELLGDPHPRRTIEDDLLRASARLVRLQPEEYQEASLYAYRGMLAVGRLLGDETLIREALTRLDGFAERAFYHDGLWRHGDAAAHRRVVALVDGWIGRLLEDDPPAAPEEARPGAIAPAPGATASPILALARRAGESLPLGSDPAEVHLAAWPAGPGAPASGGPRLLGGAGLVRLSVGRGADALELELRGLGDYGGGPAPRLAMRVAVGGTPVLGDLDEHLASARGFDHATASHNAVIVDGLNQRESFEQARIPAPGSDILYYAADPDFQVATLDDRYAYAASTTRYRQTLIACDGPNARYALAVFEVQGGSQHDQLFHAASGSPARWRPSARTTPGPETLLPPNIPFVPTALADDGRWFVQSLGEFSGLESGRMEAPGQAVLDGGTGPSVRLHLLGDLPAWAIVGASGDPASAEPDAPGAVGGRAALVLRRRSEDGSALESTFATLIEPTGVGSPPLHRVGRLAAPEGVVALAVESADGPETLVFNPSPGTPRIVDLLDGRTLRTDGLAVRVAGARVWLAGGTYAEVDGVRADQPRALGTILATGRGEVAAPDARGWFETAEPLPDPDALAGRALIVRHGDGTCRAWTVARAANRQDGGARIEVIEMPGFRIDSTTGEAVYYQFPRTRAPGPHTFRVARIARSG